MNTLKYIWEIILNWYSVTSAPLYLLYSKLPKFLEFFEGILDINQLVALTLLFFIFILIILIIRNNKLYQFNGFFLKKILIKFNFLIKKINLFKFFNKLKEFFYKFFK